MIKGNDLALIILILIFSMVPVSCNNNSSINSSQDSFSNATGLYQSPSDSLSETTKIALGEIFDRLDWLEKIISIIAGTLAIVAILVGFYLGLFPNARNGARKRIIGLLKRIGLNKSDPEEVSTSSSPEKEPSKNIIKLPYPLNPNFTGRQKILSALAEPLIQAASSPKIFALVGNGGMGKTQIALHHAHIPENDFKYVWWLRSEEPSTLLDDYVGIAENLKLPGWNLRDTDQTIKAVKQWLEGECSSHWLLVFDNAQKPDDLMRFLPVAGRGQVIITSRLSVWDGMAKTLDVDVFQRDEKQDESVEFLFKRTGQNDKKGATILARELGACP